MKNIRIGNDILFVWQAKYSDGNIIDLSSVPFIVYLITPVSRVRINIYTIQDGKLYWRFYGKDQEQLGEYSMTLVINPDRENMMVIDASGIFRLVSYVDANKLGLTDNNPVVVERQSTTTINPMLPVIPVIGKNGNWFVNGKDTGMPARGENGPAGSIAYPVFEINPSTGRMTMKAPYYYGNDTIVIEKGHLKMKIQ